MFKSQIVGLALNRRKWSEMGPESSPGLENPPPGMPRPFSRLWDHSRGPKSKKKTACLGSSAGVIGHDFGQILDTALESVFRVPSGLSRSQRLAGVGGDWGGICACNIRSKSVDRSECFWSYPGCPPSLVNPFL